MKGSYFDIDELTSTTPTPPENSGALGVKFLEIHSHKLESIKHLVGDLPKEKEIFFIWTMKSFNAFTFIPYLVKYAGIIDELIISTYSINKRIVAALIRLIDAGKVKKVQINISESIKHRMPAVVDELNSVMAQRKDVLKIHYSWVHAKVSLVRIGSSKYIIEGSGNWAENAKHEQYIFLRDERVFDFRRKWITTELVSGSAAGS